MFRKHYILSFFDTKKTAIKKIKLYIRSYNKFRKDNKIFIFRKIKGELTKINIKFDNFFKKILIFLYDDYNQIDLDLSLSQYAFQKTSFRKLNLNILESAETNTSLSFPLPLEYLDTLSKNNIKFSKIKCILLWFIYCFLYWGYGNLILLKIIIKSLINLFKYQAKTELSFFQINKENLQFKSINKNRESYDLISWFLKFYNKKNIKINKISHDNNKLKNFENEKKNIQYKDHPYYFIRNFLSILKFFLIGIFLSLLSLIFLFFGKWQPGLIIGEIFKTNSFLFTSKEKLSKKYLFHFSETIYRPMWTYFEKKFDIEIILYFYSTYDAPKDKLNFKIDKAFEFGNISWSKILVWDEIQKNIISKYISKKVKNLDIQVVGPIWFRDKDFVFKNKKFRILIFDMEVQRNSLHFGFGEIGNYNNIDKKLTLKFIRDIISVFKHKNVEFVLKRKREIGNNVQTNYKNYISYLKSNNLLLEVDQNISPQYLMENSDVVITMPFTSANMYKVSNKIKNIYYDPTHYIDKKDPASRSITVINGIDELKVWKKNNTNYD